MRAPGLPFRPIILLAGIAAVLAFAASTGQLIIRGYATTVDLDTIWSYATCAEYHTWPSLTPSGDDYGETLGKEVATTSLAGAPGNALSISIANGYPSYAVKCTLRYKSLGSLPIQAQSVSLVPVNGLTPCSISGTEDDKTLACSQLTVAAQNALPDACLEDGEEHELLLFTHVEQPSGESTTVEYRLEISFGQCEDDVGGGQGGGDCDDDGHDGHHHGGHGGDHDDDCDDDDHDGHGGGGHH